MDFFSDELCEPYGCRIAYTEVPVRPDWYGRVELYTGDPPFLTEIINVFSVIRSLLSPIEVTIELLLNQIFGHTLATFFIDLLWGHYSSFIDSKFFHEPILRISFCNLKEIPSMIASSGSINECTPATICRKNRFDKVICCGVHEGPFRENNSFRVRTHD